MKDEKLYQTQTKLIDSHEDRESALVELNIEKDSKGPLGPTKRKGTQKKFKKKNKKQTKKKTQKKKHNTNTPKTLHLYWTGRGSLKLVQEKLPP